MSEETKFELNVLLEVQETSSRSARLNIRHTTKLPRGPRRRWLDAPIYKRLFLVKILTLMIRKWSNRTFPRFISKSMFKRKMINGEWKLSWYIGIMGKKTIHF